jgi:hypothetical protein
VAHRVSGRFLLHRSSRLSPVDRISDPGESRNRPNRPVLGLRPCYPCHDPHREAESSASFHETKCLTCHSQERALQDPPVSADGFSTLAPTGRRTACQVNPAKDCLKCHMPKVPVAELHTSLTDHYVRIRTVKALRDQPGGAE